MFMTTGRGYLNRILNCDRKLKKCRSDLVEVFKNKEVQVYSGVLTPSPVTPSTFSNQPAPPPPPQQGVRPLHSCPHQRPLLRYYTDNFLHLRGRCQHTEPDSVSRFTQKHCTDQSHLSHPSSTPKWRHVMTQRHHSSSSAPLNYR